MGHITKLVSKSDDKANEAFVALFVAVVLVPIFGMSGLIVDMGRDYIVRDRLIFATNAAAQAAAASLPATDSTQRYNRAREVFEANFPDTVLGSLAPIDFRLETIGTADPPDQFRVRVEVPVPPTIMAILGVQYNTTVSGFGEAKRYSGNKIRLIEN